jgi:hypothetical protein
MGSFNDTLATSPRGVLICDIICYVININNLNNYSMINNNNKTNKIWHLQNIFS